MKVKMFRVDVFTDKPFCGNPAGVVLDAENLDDGLMQKIAAEINLSETAFVISKGECSFEVRFFTPECEIDLCGHATIAAFYVLSLKEQIIAKKIGVVEAVQNTKIGKLPVRLFFEDGKIQRIMMQQGQPKSYGEISRLYEICEFMNLDISDIGLNNIDLKPEIISTGLKDMIIPVRNRMILDKLRIDFGKLKKYSLKNDIIGVHVFSTGQDRSIEEAFCRNFAPAVGIDEESATGTSNGALTYYLSKNDLLKNNKLLVHQGSSLNRPSQIFCEIIKRGSNYTVHVGGKARIVIEGTITV